ncbi:protein SMAX1-LIKE 4-like isoform X2 [Prosopis cineraria]|uniref:protein SMAX1-LIKE 4-like isoform X2 n=1 Tax=Prosopis cineraria TaxID=364024 RepID=UPI0024105EBF|nr:protein SMAX1-LIKE 4-like isoform X2 [Prosopis cineraria]
MRSGGCGLPQTLTAEAASVLKHSLGLARRRGHAQVTPLHVAATLLTLRSSSLRRACLKSQSHGHHHTMPSSSHPLHCRALELCFNVALNRLPTSTPPSFLHPHQPSLSNALVAALKRAQAHHRRGCIEQQQQPLLTPIKVELEQLIISILDDPSVSRVMREAGFSSTAVKNNLDDSSPSSVFQCYNSSGGVYSSPCSPSPTSEVPYSFDCNNPVLFSPLKRAPLVFSCNYNEDVKLVLDIMLRKKRKNTVIVCDSLSFTEGLVEELMGRFKRGEVPDELKSTRFIKFQFSSSYLSFLKREQVEMSLLELERKVDSVASLGGGVIVYIGDLKWTVGEANLSEKENGVSPVEYLIAEIASYQTYMRCQTRQPSLETQWALQAVPVPSSNGLGLSLHASSVLDSKPFFNDKEEQDKLACCAECSSSYEKEAQMFKPGQKNLLPSWLQSHNTEAHHKDELAQLRRKWNRLCHCLHQSKHFQNQWGNTLYSNYSSNAKIYPYSSSYPWWPNQGSNSITTDSSSICFADPTVKPSYSSSNLVPRFRRQQSCTIEFNFGNENQKHKATEPSLDSLKGMEGKEVKITLALGNSSFGDSGQTVENISDHTTLLRQAHICKLLQENVPWQSETLVSSIAEAFFLDSKSAKQNSCCWLYLQGNDSTGKRRLARAIAESLFGSAHLLFSLDMKKKEILSSPCSEMLSRALKTHEQVVVLIENADFADPRFRKFLADGFETGKFGDFSTKEKPGETIFILTNNGSTAEQNQDDSVISLVLRVISETQPGLDHKRKAEWDLLTKFKRPRTEDKEEMVLVSEQKNCKKDFSRQSSFNTLDLNIRAEEDDDDDGEDKAGGISPISSNLRRETNVLLDSIENRFVFNQNLGADKREIEALFSSKIKRYFEEVWGKQWLEKFSVEERVIEEMRVGCGSFTNSLFEKWLKDIFQSSLKEINLRGKEEGILFKLCWGGKGDRILNSGFMSSSLPRNIQVSYS